MTTTTITERQSIGILIGAIGAGAIALLMFVRVIVSVTPTESTTDTAAVQTYAGIAGAAAAVALVLAVVWAARRRRSAIVLWVAVGGGILAGLLMVLYQVIYDDSRGGIIPLWVGTVLVVVITAGSALLSIGLALIAFATLTRSLSSRSFVVGASAAVAALVGVGAGILFGRGSTFWISLVLWTLAPALYVAVTFPGLTGSRRRDDGNI